MKLWITLGLLFLLPLAAPAVELRLEFALDGRQLGQFCGSTADVMISEIRGFVTPGEKAPGLGLELRSGLPLEKLRDRLVSAGLASIAPRLETTGNGEFLLFSSDSVSQTLPDPPGDGEWLVLGLTLPQGRMEFRCDGGQARLLVPVSGDENGEGIARRLQELVQPGNPQDLLIALRRLLAVLTPLNQLAGQAVFAAGGEELHDFALAVNQKMQTMSGSEDLPAEEKLCQDQRSLTLLAAKFAWLQGRPLKTIADLIAAGFLVRIPVCPSGSEIELVTREDGSLDAVCTVHTK